MAFQRAFLGFACLSSVLASTVPLSRSNCKLLPGDKDWPDSAAWSSLNETVNWRLTETVPLGSVCHDAPFNNYDADACAELQEDWNKTSLAHMDNPAEVLSMWFKNYSCSPFTPRSQPCELGNLVSYTINVGSAEDVQAGIAFARDHNVRLVIKNTGHDYLGKSTGKGGLSLWTHHLNSTEYIPEYTSPNYQGPAMKLGAGVQGYVALAAAHAVGYRIVTGVCPTVGVAGGYSQGGGHSILSGMYGLGADNVLEWEVVTMDGQHLVASPTENADLYWALSGGGPGTFAVVLSMTTRLHTDGAVAGATMSFDDSDVGNDAFWDAIGAFHQLLPSYVDSGNSIFYTMTNNAFIVSAATMPGADLDTAQGLLQPFVDDLEARGISASVQVRLSSSYDEHFRTFLNPSGTNEGTIPYEPFQTSRIVPRELVLDGQSNTVITQTLRNISAIYGPSTCEALNMARALPHPENAVNPSWREALFFCIQGGAWDPLASPDDMARKQDFAANTVQPLIDAATPGGSIYLNEANYMTQNWQDEMYGPNFVKLSGVKTEYDPEGLLYAKTSIGSESWIEDDDGRLCKV